jgi:hypothetical protein
MRRGKRERCIAFLRGLLICSTLCVQVRLVRMGKRECCITFLRCLFVCAAMNIPRSI